MTIKLGAGDERHVSELSDEELVEARNAFNQHLREAFFISSNAYNAGAEIVRELDREMLRRELDGPPWLYD